MIASLRGELTQVTSIGAVIDVNGVGYEVLLPANIKAGLPPVGTTVSLVILTQVREDAITLYGFQSVEEKELYLALVSVSQIGPKLALAVMGNITSAELFDAIVLEDVKRLSMVPGVGKKTAARMCLELKDKLPGTMDRPAGGAVPSAPVARSARAALIDALQHLGFRTTEINAVIREIRPQADEPLEELMRRALSKLTPKG